MKGWAYAVLTLARIFLGRRLPLPGCVFKQQGKEASQPYGVGEGPANVTRMGVGVRRLGGR